jgi:hypothetical protein
MPVLIYKVRYVSLSFLVKTTQRYVVINAVDDSHARYSASLLGYPVEAAYRPLVIPGGGSDGSVRLDTLKVGDRIEVGFPETRTPFAARLRLRKPDTIQRYIASDPTRRDYVLLSEKQGGIAEHWVIPGVSSLVNTAN